MFYGFQKKIHIKIITSFNEKKRSNWFCEQVFHRALNFKLLNVPWKYCFQIITWRHGQMFTEYKIVL